MSFVDYMEVMNSASSVQVRFSWVEMWEPFEIWKTATVLSYILQIIWIILWAAITIKTIIKLDNSPYCKRCKKYKQAKVLKIINTEDMDSGELRAKMKKIYKYRMDMIGLKKLLDSLPEAVENSLKEWSSYFGITLIYCNECLTWDLFIEFYIIKKYDEHHLEKFFPIELEWNVATLLD